ncbi:MAG: hypothetical protein R3D32_14855 [Nitratireductor sp.]
MRDVFDTLQFPIFLAREMMTDAGKVVEVHTTSAARKGVAAALQAAFKEANPEVRVRVHGHGDFLQPNTLETLRDRFGKGRIIYDPTGAFSRMDEFIGCAKAIRSKVGAEVTGIFLEPTQRTMYLVFTTDKTASPASDDHHGISGAVKSAESAVARWRNANPASSHIPVVATAEIPRGFPLVPIDGYSGHYHKPRGYFGSLRVAVTALLASLGLATGAISAAAHVSDDLVVSDVKQVGAESGQHYAYKADLFDDARDLENEVPAGQSAIRVLDAGLFSSLDTQPHQSLNAPKIIGAAVAFAALTFDVPARDVEQLRLELAEIMGPRLANAIVDAVRNATTGELLEVAQFDSGGYGGSMGSDSLN